MKKKITIIAIIIILASAGIWHFNKTNKNNLPAPILIAQATYICQEGKTINASYYKGEQKQVEPGQPPIPSGSIKLTLSDGQNLDLPQTISADGSRYANNDESFVFWSKGDGALILENNIEKTYIGCVVITKDPEALPNN